MIDLPPHIAAGAGACLVGVNGVDLPFHRRENVIESGIGRHSRLRFRLRSVLVGGHRSSKVRPLANAPGHPGRDVRG